ncbi:MAG: CinA family protein [Coriobacteriia bacterium]|nr:CinA family protein [Coriobacteriia bacterium]
MRIAQSLIACARERNLTLGAAESCTGGMVAAALTSVPGASEVFKGGVVSYANEVKTTLLGVDSSDLESVGAVSEEVALQMAQGARTALQVDYAVSATGIAGPDGGSEEKPVGTVWIAVAGPQGAQAACHNFTGSREEVRKAATEAALQSLLESVTLK